MAFVDDENLDPNAPPPSGGGSTLITGQGGSSNVHTGPAPSSPNAPGGMPGNFVGIQQYLNANQPQSSKLAGQVGGYVSDLGTSARGAASGAQGQFQNAINQNTVNLDQSLFNEAQANPQQVAADAAKKAEFQKEYNANYGGPSSFEGSDYYAPALQATRAASDATTLLGTPEGQKSVVANLEKKTGGYSTPGAQSFDTALLQAAPNAREVIGQTIAKNSDLKANLDALAAEGNKAAKNAAATTVATNQAYQGTFGNQQLQSALEKALTAKASEANTSALKQGQSIVEKLVSNQPLTDQELQSLDINKDNLSQIQAGEKYVSDLNPYTGVVSPNITGQQIASSDDYARYLALNELTGQNANFLTNPNLANSANYNSVKPFNLNQYLADVAAAQKAEADRIAEANKAPPRTHPQIEPPTAGQVLSAVPGAIGNAISKVGNAISKEGIKAGAPVQAPTAPDIFSKIGKFGKKVFSDKNLKTNVEKFNASAFLDSMIGAKHG